MTRTTTPTVAQTAETLLRDVGFVLAMTQKVKDGMGSRPNPPAAGVQARKMGRKQLVAAA